ncbi:hypothetical protein EB796_015092 [Bugula neritina]|uniref:Uncharacterized protein n=1 Tax=Bugula neritina TaxID=10212 RepID=A0A7J7JMH2_BUGNE|nr:hypothetical protein EB796_015092 [Bugula neritina]
MTLAAPYQLMPLAMSNGAERISDADRGARRLETYRNRHNSRLEDSQATLQAQYQESQETAQVCFQRYQDSKGKPKGTKRSRKEILTLGITPKRSPSLKTLPYL